MGTFTAGITADGVIPTSQTAIYTAPALTVIYLKQLFLFNTNAVDQTIDLWLNLAGTARHWRRLVLSQNESADMLENGETITLPAGGKIEAQSTTLNAVQFTLTAIKEV